MRYTGIFTGYIDLAIKSNEYSFGRNTSIGTSGSGSTSAYASDSDSVIIDVSSGNESEALNNSNTGTTESPWPYLDS